MKLQDSIPGKKWENDYSRYVFSNVEPCDIPREVFIAISAQMWQGMGQEECANKRHNVPPHTVDSQTSESYAHFSILWRQTMPEIFSSWAPPNPGV